MNPRQTKIITAYRKGNECRWIAALAASRLQRGQLDPIAEELAVTVRAVRDLRAAGYAFRVLRYPRTEANFRVTDWARVLSVYHFSKIGYLLADEKITRHEALEDLRIAFEERLTIAEFAQQLSNVYSNDGEDQWRGWLNRMLLNARKVADGHGVPDEIKEAAQMLIDFCEERELT